MMKKSEISLNAIIIAILILIALVVFIFCFVGIEEFNPEEHKCTYDCLDAWEECLSKQINSNCNEEIPNQCFFETFYPITITHELVNKFPDFCLEWRDKTFCEKCMDKENIEDYGDWYENFECSKKCKCVKEKNITVFHEEESYSMFYNCSILDSNNTVIVEIYSHKYDIYYSQLPKNDDTWSCKYLKENITTKTINETKTKCIKFEAKNE